MLWTFTRRDTSETFQAAVRYGAGTFPFSVAVGDFNRDGRQDLAVANGESQDVSVLLGNGNGTFQTAVSHPAAVGADVVVADLDRDGKEDLVVAGSGSNVLILAGRGDGTFQAAVAYGVGAHATKVALGDFDQDGSPDLITANNLAGNVSVLLNDCRALTTVALSSSKNPSAVGEAVTFTATVTSAAGMPTGSVVFKDGTTSLATVALSAGSASFTTSSLAAGSHSITVSYLGTADFWGRTPSPVVQVVTAASLPTLSINDVTGVEGNSGASSFVFTVSLSAPSSQTVTIAYETSDSSATAGQDYTSAAGTVTFAPGTLSRNVSIEVLGDGATEGDETFFVNLKTPVNSDIADDKGQGTISNDDGSQPLPRVSIDDRSVAEGAAAQA